MSSLDNEPHLPHFLTPPEYKRKNMLVKYLVLLNICNFCTLVYFLLITMLCLQKPCFMWHVRSHHCHVNCQVVIWTWISQPILLSYSTVTTQYVTVAERTGLQTCDNLGTCEITVITNMLSSEWLSTSQ